MHVHSCPLLAGNNLDHCIQYPGYCRNLRQLHTQVRAVSDECPVHAQGRPLLGGNHLDHRIHYQGYCKNLLHLYAKVRNVSDGCPVHLHGSTLLGGNHLDHCIVPRLLQEVAKSTCLGPSSFRLMSNPRT